MGGGIDDRDGVARAVGDGIGDPEDLDATAFVVDASRHRAMDDCARAGLDRQVARNCAVEDETDAPMQRRIDRKSTRLTPVTNAHLVCRLLLEKKNTNSQ